MVQSLLQTAAVRDFTGGLNLTDNPYNLASKYQMVSDNVIVGPDGALSPRMGYKYIANLKQGSTVQVDNPEIVAFTFFSSSSWVLVTWPGHGLTSAHTIEFPDPLVVNAFQLQGAYSVRTSSVNEFFIAMRGTSSEAIAAAPDTPVTRIYKSTHLGPGIVLEMAFFQGNMVVFDSSGVINAINIDTGLITRIWDATKSAATLDSPPPWRAGLKHVSYCTFKQTLLAVDGRLNDKPIEINFQRTTAMAPVQYLADVTDNNFVYPADLIQSFNGYVLLYGSNNLKTHTSTPPPITLVDISAKNTSAVFPGNPNPADAVQIDVGRASQTVDPRITAASYIRNKVFVAFPDSSMMGSIGNYVGDKHEPSFGDQVPQHGALNHRVVQNIGNDLFMCDYAGIPAFSQSVQSGVIAPERLSQLIYPELNKHLSRLSQNTLKYKIWSVYNVRDRMYMLFMPKFDEASVRTSSGDVIFVVTDFRIEQEVILRVPNHGMSAGDYITIDSPTLSCPGLSNANIVGTRRVVAVVDRDNMLIKVGAVPTVDGAIGTCTALTMTPIDDESICYAYQYNPTMRIRRWTRMRGWYFIAGATTNDGRVLVSDRDNRIWQLGTVDRPLYADQIGYTTDDPDQPLSGIAINWAAETPWSDMQDRISMKVGEHATFDVEGTGKFNFTMFVDNIYDDKATYQLAPAAGMSIAMIPNVIGEDNTAFGAAAQTYGMGRRAREQFNYHFPFRAKLARMRFQGAAKEYLRIVAVTLSYKKGSIYR